MSNFKALNLKKKISSLTEFCFYKADLAKLCVVILKHQVTILLFYS